MKQSLVRFALAVTKPMRFVAIATAGVLCLSPVAAAQETENAGPGLLQRLGLEVELAPALGYRLDDLNWTIGGQPGSSVPNILSELIWSDMNIAQVELAGRALWQDRLYVRASVGMGDILSGDNQDSDYEQDNRVDEFSRSNNKADGDVMDYSVGIGHQFRFTDEDVEKVFLFTPIFLGYSWHYQNLVMKDGFQTVAGCAGCDTPLQPGSLGSFDGLNSTYDTEWEGVWYGVDMELMVNDRFFFHVTLEKHEDIDYYAEANWNLRDAFAHPVSFVHRADGQGDVWKAGLTYRWTDRWEFSGEVKRSSFSTGRGTDTTYCVRVDCNEAGVPVSPPQESVLALNWVHWESTSYLFRATYRWR